MLNTLLLSLCAISALLCVSCQMVFPAWDNTSYRSETYPYKSTDIRPELLVVYCPPFITASQLSHETVQARPLRDHGGIWTDEAMRYDLAAMQKLGISGVLLKLRPQDLLERSLLERIRRFCALSAAQSPSFSVGFLLFSDTPISIGTGNMAQFICQNGLHELPAKLTASTGTERPLFLFDAQSITLTQQKFPEESKINMLLWDGTSGHLGGTELEMVHASKYGNYSATAYSNSTSQAGTPDANNWKILRSNGTALAAGLWNAFRSGRNVICLQSWNDFSDGSFIVDNTLDHQQFSLVLARELAALEQLRLKK